MNDAKRKCEKCGHEHPWGVVSKSEDGVNLYGPKPTEHCAHFRPIADDQTTLPAFMGTLQELWAQTNDLSPQATMATRVAVTNIRSLAKGKNSYAAMAAQWPEFMGFVMSQITDLRGALFRDESKFANLVAHTDEIVTAMRDVTQLAERLNRQSRMLNGIMDRLDELKRDRNSKYSADVAALEHFGLMPVTWVDEADWGKEVFIRFPEPSGSQGDAVLIDPDDD